VFKKKRSFLYPIISSVVAISLIFSEAKISQAFPWQEILIRGFQVIQISNLSDQQEVALGKQMRQQLINSNRIRVYQNPSLNRYVESIGQKLVAVSDRPNLPYTFTIVEDDQVNAFATMGGFIYLNTGLIRTAENEAELASVIAHEIGHVVGKHSQTQIKQQAITQGLLTAAGLNSTQLVQLGVALALDLPHSREDEYEADLLGLQMLKSAGYAPGATVDFMRKLQKHGSNTPTFLSTHPAAKERVVALQQKISSNEAYQGYGLDRQAYLDNIRPLSPK
jgi:predicted Zn-dependent protease